MGGGRRARTPTRTRGFAANRLAVALGSPAPSDLEVTAGTGPDARTHVAPVGAGVPLSGWMMALPVAES